MKQYIEVLNSEYRGVAFFGAPKKAIVKARLLNKPSLWERYMLNMTDTHQYGWALVEKFYYPSCYGDGDYLWDVHKWFPTLEEAQEYKTSLETVY